MAPGLRFGSGKGGSGKGDIQNKILRFLAELFEANKFERFG